MDNGNQMYKILCLHGYRQNGKTFQTKSGGFRKIVKNHFTFVFINAPHIIPKGDQNPEDDANCLSWWFSGSNPLYFSSKHVSDYVYGFDESLKNVYEAFETYGPFDGILGFSQGASMLSLICALRQLNEFPYHFKFAIFVSGFRSLTSSHVSIYNRLISINEKISIPTMHIIGRTDQVVDQTISQSLANELFENPFIVYHDGGHTVPSQSAFKAQYLQFIATLGIEQ